MCELVTNKEIKQCEVKNAINIENTQNLNIHENTDTINIDDKFNDLDNKIKTIGSTSGDNAYNIFVVCFYIIQQDLVSTLRNATEVIYEENKMIKKQINKLEYYKNNINMILK